MNCVKNSTTLVTTVITHGLYPAQLLHRSQRLGPVCKFSTELAPLCSIQQKWQNSHRMQDLAIKILALHGHLVQMYVILPSYLYRSITILVHHILLFKIQQNNVVQNFQKFHAELCWPYCRLHPSLLKASITHKTSKRKLSYQCN